MLHHSNSRHQRNRGSKTKTLIQVTLLVGVLVWLLFQVKHSYDKKNEYFNDTKDQLADDDRSMFQGRKERVGSYGEGNVEMVFENSDAVSKPEEEESGETVFEKDNSDSHDGDTRNTERSQTEEGQASGADDNAEAHSNDQDETSGHSAAHRNDPESKSDIHSTGDVGAQNNNVQDEIAGEINGTPHEELTQNDGSTNGDQTNASRTGSDGEQAGKKGAVEFQSDSESHADDAKTGTSDEHPTETLPDETGNIPSVHNENSQHDPSENQGDATSTTSDADEHSTSETVHIETGSEHEGATSSGAASGDAEKGNSVESNSFDSFSVEENTGSSHGDEKGAETGTANQASGSKEANSEEGNAATQVFTEQAANMVAENSQGVSTAEVANGSSEETKPLENWVDGATNAPGNGEQDDIKIETNTSTKDEHNGGDSTSGSNGSNGSGPEQTGKTETQSSG